MRKLILMSGAIAALGAMSPAERSKGRYMRGPDGHEGGGKSASELATEAKAAFDTKHNAVKEIAEKALAEAAKGIEMSGTVKELADQAITGMNEAKSRLTSLEQKLDARETPERHDITAGERFTNDEGFKAFAGETRPRGRILVNVKDISSLTTAAPGSVGTMVQPERASPIMLPQRRMTVRDLLTPGTMDGNALEYVKETGFTNSAGHCLVMRTTMGGKPVAFVVLDAFGKYTHMADASRLRKWVETDKVTPVAPAALAYKQQRASQRQLQASQ